jgi:dienelactone hydrolase
MDSDSLAPADEIAAWSQAITGLGVQFTVFRYPGSGHLYTDPDLPDYDGDSAELT